MPNLASRKEGIKYGGLGNKFDVEDMISQCKVMYDNLAPREQGCDDKDIIRLYEIQERLINIILELNIIVELNQN